ncbi:MAG: ABC transporter ATP-binding protein, partial [Bacteroidota bacterium]
MSVLKTENLAVGFSSAKILMKSVNAELRTGRFVGLVGQNGVGKSTFIKTLCGLLTAQEGEVLLEGKSIGKFEQKEIARKIALVLTDRPSSLHLSVLELVSMGRYPHSNWLGILNQKDKEKIGEAITKMEISHITSKKLFELSDG